MDHTACIGLGWVGFLLLHVGHNHPRVNPKNVRGQGQVDWPRMLPGAHPDYLWLEGSWIGGLVTCAVVKAAFPIPTVGSRPGVYKSCVVTLGWVVGVVKVKSQTQRKCSSLLDVWLWCESLSFLQMGWPHPDQLDDKQMIQAVCLSPVVYTPPPLWSKQTRWRWRGLNRLMAESFQQVAKHL
jgi:hypothetical protein